MSQVKPSTGHIYQDRCRCCLATDRVMVSVHTESTHNDNKTLDDYLSVLFNYDNGREWIYPTQICLRCSKALQVAYHFMLMSLENKGELENKSRSSIKTLGVTDMGNSMANESLFEIKKCERETTPEFREQGMECQRYAGNPIKEENLYGRADDWTLTEDCEWKCNKNSDEYDLKKEPVEEIFADNSLGHEKVQGPFKCRYCENSFTFHETLIEHTQRIHKQMIPFKCKICTFYTCFIESLWKHYKKQHQLDDLENRLYRTKELLTISAEVEPPYDITLKCNECDFQTHTQTQLDEHLSVEHDIQEDKDIFTTIWYNCPSCYQQFNDKTSVKIHYTMTHNPQRSMNINAHSCDNCGKTFDRKTSLLSHERHCALQDPVSCNFCKLEFSSVFKYEQHLQTTHSVEIKHECEICRKTFMTSSSLAVHRKRHNNRYYQCNLCPKNYINNAELEVHRRRIHSRVRHKMCSICRKSFEQLHQLRDHMKTEHSKSIQCRYCQFTSTSKFAIEVHQYRHTGRPYKCNFCPKQYVLRKDIREHCKKVHDFDITDEELAAMFIDKHGYPSRFDAFSKQNNDLQINVIDEMDLEMELKEFNLTFEDIINDLFGHNEARDGEL